MNEIVSTNSYNPTYLDLPLDLEYDEWIHRGKVLILMFKAGPWWLGDWLNFGEDRYGEKYVQAVELTGKDLDTLRKYQWVAKAIPPERRLEILSYSHHAAVAALPPPQQTELLKQASKNEWNESQMRQAVRELKGTPTVDESDMISNECPFCQADLTEWLQKR